MSRALIVVSRVASGEAGDGFADLDPENRARAGKVNDDPTAGYPSEEWLTERAKIMERVTVPAMRRVAVPFTWVWRSAPERREQVAEIAQRLYPAAVVTDDVSLTSDAVAPDASSFLTVRLDSDDAILPSALDAAAEMDLSPNTLLNWWRGWRLNWGTGQVMTAFWKLRVQGPFMGITHESRQRMLASGIPHTYAREGREVVSVEERSWVQTIHGLNQLSKWRGEDLLPDDVAVAVLKRGGIACPSR